MQWRSTLYLTGTDFVFYSAKQNKGGYMKTLVVLAIGMACASQSIGQNNTVSILYNGQNREIIIDGKIYEPSPNYVYNSGTTGNYKFKIITTDIVPGRHTLQVARNNGRNTQTTFNLRKNYDLEITVAGNGSIQQRETYKNISTSG